MGLRRLRSAQRVLRLWLAPGVLAEFEQLTRDVRHKLRKGLKKLRYLSLFAKRDAKRFIKRLKALQGRVRLCQRRAPRQAFSRAAIEAHRRSRGACCRGLSDARKMPSQYVWFVRWRSSPYKK
jgi:hypothetical protein